MPYAEIEAWFKHAATVVNTSRLEGFPNVFLQAAKYRRPIISLRIDPDGMLSEHGCGVMADDDPAALEAGLRRCLDDTDYAAQLGTAAYDYVAQRHAIAGRIDELAHLLHDVQRPKPTGKADS